MLKKKKISNKRYLYQLQLAILLVLVYSTVRATTLLDTSGFVAGAGVVALGASAAGGALVGVVPEAVVAGLFPY